MSSDWYLWINEETRGPYIAEQVRHLFATGAITRETYIKTSPDEDWRLRVGELPALLSAPESAGSVDEKQFLQGLRARSKYEIARALARVLIGVFIMLSWVGFVLALLWEKMPFWIAFFSGAALLLTSLLLVAFLQILQAVLDGADALVEIAAKK